VTLLRRWPLAGAEALRDRLAEAYGAPGRGYHDLRHLTEVLDRLEDLAAAGEEFDGLEVRLAAWFHDGVYDGEPGAEERSARWAEEVLPGHGVDPARVREVARLVRLTERHDPAPGDRNGAVLSDADLAVLAAPAERYEEYVAGVRQEYAAVGEEAFRRGRRAVLEALGAQDPLFRSTAGRRAWEGAARANLARELERLSPA
jgi:predicted metal-dependent HD superfamily phosphohydrolase